MPTRKRITAFTALALITWSIVATCFAGYYYVRFQECNNLVLEYEAISMRVNIRIDYGNETKVWYNDTLVSMSCSLLNATEMVSNVKVTYWEVYQASFVDSINNVANNATHFWMWWNWNPAKREWEYGSVSADQYRLSPGQVILWRYED